MKRTIPDMLRSKYVELLADGRLEEVTQLNKDLIEVMQDAKEAVGILNKLVECTNDSTKH